MGQTPSTRYKNQKLKLLKAVKTGDLSSVRKVLAKGEVSINQVRDHRGSPLLCLAVRKGDVNMVDLLLKEGVPKTVNLLKEGQGHSWEVSMAAHPEEAVLTKVYLSLDTQSSVDADYVNEDFVTCRSCGSRGVAFQDTVDLNVTDKKGLSPIHITAISGALDIAKVLVDSGADVNKPDTLEASPLHAAAAYSHEDICKLLLDSNGTVNACEKSGLTPLHLAVMTGGVGVVRTLLSHGAWAHTPDHEGRSPVHFASVLSAFRGLDDVVRTNRSLMLNLLLLQHGGNITYQDDSHCSPMSYALIKDNTRLVRMYIDFGIQLEKQDLKRLTEKHPRAAERYFEELEDDCKVPSLYRTCRRSIMGHLAADKHTCTDSQLYNNISKLELPRTVENFLKYKL